MDYSLAFISGATSGIGEALARFLAKQNISLLLTGRNQEKLEELKNGLGVPVETMSADLTNSEERKKLTTWIHEKKPDLIINDAGIGFYGEMIALPTDKQLQLLEIDVLAVVEITIEAAKMLSAAHKKGTILNVSSAAGFYIFPYFTLYGASKCFLNYFSRAADYELKDKGIRVLVACPGEVETSFFKKAGGITQTHQKEIMQVDEVVNAIWQQIKAETPLVIINWRYKLLTFISHFTPMSLIAKLASNEIKNRLKPRT